MLSGTISVEYLRAMNLDKHYWSASRKRWTTLQLDAVAPYLTSIDDHLLNLKGVCLWGSHGVGKTFIAATVCKYVQDRCKVNSFFITAAKLRNIMIKDQIIFQESMETYGDLVREAKFLVIDDVGKEYHTSSGYAESAFGELLDERFRQNKITSITTHLNPDDYRTAYSPAVADLTMECMVGCEVRDINHRLANSIGW